jgi:multiple antibiotic resistance protein
MDAITEHLVLSLGSLLAVLNPLATVPPFVAMTEGNDKEERIAMARRASMIACVVLLVFTFAGPRLLGFFGVSMAAF